MGKATKAPAKKASAKSSSKLSSAINLGKSIVGGMSGGSTAKSGGGKRRRKSIAWYANAIAKLKLKKRYEKLKYRV